MQYYLVLCRLSIDYKIRDLEWPWMAILLSSSSSSSSFLLFSSVLRRNEQQLKLYLFPQVFQQNKIEMYKKISNQQKL